MTNPVPAQPPATPGAVTEDRRKHFDFIQAAVSRMSSSSSTAKGWLLPVVTATYGYAASQRSAEVALLGMAAVGLFAFLDAHYLRQERAFRALYRAAVAGSVAVYEMNNGPYFRRRTATTKISARKTAAGLLSSSRGRWGVFTARCYSWAYSSWCERSGDPPTRHSARNRAQASSF